MINFFHRSSPGFEYFFCLLQELKQVGSLVHCNDRSIDLKMEEEGRKRNLCLIVNGTEEDRKQLQQLARELFEEAISGESNRDESLSYIKKEETLNLKETVPLTEYNLLCKLFSSQFVDHLNKNYKLEYENYGIIHFEVHDEGQRRGEYILQVKSIFSSSSILDGDLCFIEDFKVVCSQYRFVHHNSAPLACAATSLFNIFRSVFLKPYTTPPVSSSSSSANTSNNINEEVESNLIKCGKSSSIVVDDDDATLPTVADSFLNFDHYYYMCNSCGSSNVCCKSSEHCPPPPRFDHDSNYSFSNNPLARTSAKSTTKSLHRLKTRISSLYDEDDPSNYGPFTTFK